MLNFSKKITKKENDDINDRRKAPDIWIYIARILAVGGWILFLFALIMSYYAAPESDFGVLRYKDISIRKFWLTPLTGYLYIVLWFSACASYFYLMVDNFRSRRKTDSHHFNLVLLLIISVSWVIYILTQLN